MATIVSIIVLLAVSTIAGAFILSRRRPDDLSVGGKVRGALKFVTGPFPLSVALHVTFLLLLIIGVHESRGRELLLVNLEAGGGGGNSSEMHDLDLQDIPFPDVAPQANDQPDAVDTGKILAMTDPYTRDPVGNGIGIGGIGGGIGDGHGPGIGTGFGGFISTLRRKGLDVVLVIDGTASMSMILGDVKARMKEMITSIHRLVPTARMGIVVYGGHAEPVDIQPLTMTRAKLETFLAGIQAKGGDEWEEDTLGGLKTAIEKMDWHEYAKKVIVLVGDSPPAKGDFAPLIALIRGFHAAGGVLSTVDVASEEHERFEREFWLKVHRQEAPKISPLPEFQRQTESSYAVLASTGGGTMKSLSHDSKITQQIFTLTFGADWEEQARVFNDR